MRTPAVFVVMITLLPLEAAGQGLGDAAAREKQRRKASPSQPAPTITQEQLDAASAARGTWASPDGTFRAAFPGPPEVQDKSARGEGTTYRIKSGTIAYVVNVRSQPSSASLDALAVETREAALRSLGDASVAGESSVTTPKGVAGRELRIAFTGRGTGNPGVMRNRLFLSGGRSYLVTAVAEAGGEDAPEVTAFLDSFEVLR